MTTPNKDMLQELLDSQSELQHKMPSPHPTDLYYQSQGIQGLPNPDQWEPTDEDLKPAIDFIHWNVTAATDELHELLGEIGWKPWAKSRHINLEAARGELVDAIHFILNLALVLGLDNAAEIIERYRAKHEKNAKRQQEGYDGVSTKCLGCKRALDDAGVGCVEYLPGTEFYEQQKTSFPTVDIAAFQVCSLGGGLFMRKAV